MTEKTQNETPLFKLPEEPATLRKRHRHGDLPDVRHVAGNAKENKQMQETTCGNTTMTGRRAITKGRTYTVKTWFNSCDWCASCFDHYCLLHGRHMKNMNIKRCRDWKEAPDPRPRNQI